MVVCNFGLCCTALYVYAFDFSAYYLFQLNSILFEFLESFDSFRDILLPNLTVIIICMHNDHGKDIPLSDNDVCYFSTTGTISSPLRPLPDYGTICKSRSLQLIDNILSLPRVCVCVGVHDVHVCQSVVSNHVRLRPLPQRCLQNNGRLPHGGLCPPSPT